MEVDERELIIRAKSGDREAAGELVRLHLEKMYRLAYRLTLNRDDAEDLVGETILRLLNNIENIDEKRPITPWIYTVMTRLAIDGWRREKRTLPLELDLRVEPKKVGPEVIQLEECLKKLPPIQRVCVILHYYEGYSIKEIASSLSKKEGTIKANLFKARENLKICLGIKTARE